MNYHRGKPAGEEWEHVSKRGGSKWKCLYCDKYFHGSATRIIGRIWPEILMILTYVLKSLRKFKISLSTSLKRRRKMHTSVNANEYWKS